MPGRAHLEPNFDKSSPSHAPGGKDLGHGQNQNLADPAGNAASGASRVTTPTAETLRRQKIRIRTTEEKQPKLQPVPSLKPKEPKELLRQTYMSVAVAGSSKTPDSIPYKKRSPYPFCSIKTNLIKPNVKGLTVQLSPQVSVASILSTKGSPKIARPTNKPHMTHMTKGMPQQGIKQLGMMQGLVPQGTPQKYILGPEIMASGRMIDPPRKVDFPIMETLPHFTDPQYTFANHRNAEQNNQGCQVPAATPTGLFTQAYNASHSTTTGGFWQSGQRFTDDDIKINSILIAQETFHQSQKDLVYLQLCKEEQERLQKKKLILEKKIQDLGQSMLEVQHRQRQFQLQLQQQQQQLLQQWRQQQLLQQWGQRGQQVPQQWQQPQPQNDSRVNNSRTNRTSHRSNPSGSGHNSTHKR